MVDAIRGDVRRFIVDHIASVEMLNVLLMLFLQPDRTWTADEMGRDSRTSVVSANLQLEALTAHGLAEALPGTPARYRAQPRFAEVVAAVRHTFAERRVAVITLIYSRPEDGGSDTTDPVHAFADAFKLRKDK